MSRRLILTATIVVTGALTVPVAALALHVDPTASSRPSTTTAECHDVNGDVTGNDTGNDPSNDPSDDSGGGDAMSVRIPSIVMVKLDTGGRVTAIATNSGHAPQHGDLVYVYRADGSVQHTTTLDVAHRHWRGDFSRPAVFQPQPTDSSDD